MKMKAIHERELRKGSMEVLILACLEDQPRHGYEIGKTIERRSNGVLQFQVASFYPTLYRLEKRGWIRSRWVEEPPQRRRRCYRLTAEGRRVLKAQRNSWREFIDALARVARIGHA